MELLWSSLKKRELANLAGLAEQGIHRVNNNPKPPCSFLTHTGPTIHPPHPPDLRKDQQWGPRGDGPAAAPRVREG
ncbi:hypothetical protein [Streptomyces clavuligerus]|uniref:IS630 family transposase n=1 Tax=Streptomyces clavuligerus TaxID=1901 RepID=E2PZB2_STRCL|nr:hypothetical protein [Streptomyces clavuligerus]EFG10373.1 IS630 family transposase [Streptomyces clavuligerus]WDN54974.1 transposase [Streptomyces clavuligerus]